jgi:hypothetical protein
VRAIWQYDFSGEVADIMIAAGWNEVGALVGRLFALEPPFVQIGILLAAAFGLLMVLEGLRATFMVGRDVPARRRPAPAAIVTAPRTSYRSARSAPAMRSTKLRDSAVKSYCAPRPKIQRRPSLEMHDASFETAELPQVASFEE